MATGNGEGFLSRVLQQLLEITELCEERRRQYEGFCSEYRLLLKPWPRKQDHAGIQQDSLNSNAAEAPNSNEDTRHVEKDPDLELAEKLLAKAHRVRDKHEKSLQTCEVPNGQKTSGSSTDMAPAAEDKGSQDGNRHNKMTGLCAKGSSKRQAEVTKVTSDIRETPKSGTISQSKINKLVGKTASRPRVGSARNMHAHMKAPFRTQSEPSARARRPHQDSANKCNSSAGRIAKPSVTTNSAKPNSASRLSNVTKDKPSGSKQGTKATATSSSAKQVNHFEPEPKAATQNSNIAMQRPSSGSAVSSTVTDQPMADRAGKVTGLEDHMNCMHISHQPPAISTASGVEETAFTLKNSGQSLPIPAKLRRAYACNRRLRQKAVNSCMTVNVKNEKSPSDVFMDRMEVAMLQEQNTRASSFGKVILLSSAYLHLQNLLKSINESTITEESCWIDVLRAKRTLEFVMQSYTSLESEYHQALADAGCSNCLQSSPTKPSPPLQEDMFWLPQSWRNRSLPPGGRLLYQNLQQMDAYSSLLHKVQLVQFQIAIMDTVAMEIIPVLQSMQPTDRHYMKLYRAAYALLCCDGATFPAMVTDNIENQSPEPDMLDF